MTATQHRTYTIEQIRHTVQTSDAPTATTHWFDRDTLRFFGSRVHDTTYGPDSAGLVYFVSSEYTSFDRRERAYSVRVFDPAKASIDTAGEFNAYPTRAQAHGVARRLARQ